jgi:outer membrane protein
MRKSGVAIFLMLFFLMAHNAQAQIKIGVVNLQRALDESAAGKKAVEDMRKIFESKQKTIEKRKSDLKQMQQELNSQSSLLSEEAKREKMNLYQQEMKELQRLVQDSNEELKRKESELVGKIARELRGIVKSLGKDLGYDLILEYQESGVLYRSDAVDITSQVIARYDKEQKARN